MFLQHCLFSSDRLLSYLNPSSIRISSMGIFCKQVLKLAIAYLHPNVTCCNLTFIAKAIAAFFQ